MGLMWSGALRLGIGLLPRIPFANPTHWSTAVGHTQVAGEAAMALRLGASPKALGLPPGCTGESSEELPPPGPGKSEPLLGRMPFPTEVEAGTR